MHVIFYNNMWAKDICKPHYNYQAGTQDRQSTRMCDSYKSFKQVLNFNTYHSTSDDMYGEKFRYCQASHQPFLKKK